MTRIVALTTLEKDLEVGGNASRTLIFLEGR
jgi:hypothetical protein